MEGLCEGRVDRGDSLLDDVEQNDGLRNWSNSRLRRWEKSIYLVWVGSGAVHPVGPVDDALRLLSQQMLIGSLVHLLYLIATEDESLNSPVAMLYLIDLGSDRGDDAKVLAGSLHGPPKVRLLVNRLQGAVGEDHVYRDELICDEAVVALKPAVAASKGRARVADALASPGDYWADV